ncbi:MAG: hypothetical protein KDK36_05980, partial [Leptospiraceae bacterium]|nr:hypothetical protein [Leptospiraceae bacterium]
MELLALVLVNIVFGIVLYYVISIKLTNSMRDYQNQKLKKEIQAHTLDFFKESENYLALMDSRISILKNLIKKAENMGIDFKEMHIREELDKIEEFQKKSQVPLPNIKEEKPVKNPLPAKENPTVFQKEKITNSLKEEQSPSEGGLLASLGKAFKSMMGVESGEEIETPKVTSQAQVKIQK